MASHTDEMYYHFVQRAVDAEERARQLENQLQSQQQQQQPIELSKESNIPTISKADLNNVGKLRSLFPDQDVTKMLINGELRVTND